MVTGSTPCQPEVDVDKFSQTISQMWRKNKARAFISSPSWTGSSWYLEVISSRAYLAAKLPFKKQVKTEMIGEKNSRIEVNRN